MCSGQPDSDKVRLIIACMFKEEENILKMCIFSQSIYVHNHMVGDTIFASIKSIHKF
jgi:hypothetical protein